MDSPAKEANVVPNAARCALEGCNAWALRGKLYCYRHQQQWEQNVALGADDPTPRLAGPVRRTCRARGCRRVAAKDSDYCPRHTAEVRDGTLVVGDAGHAAGAIAEGFAALLAHLDTNPPDCLAVLQREVDMLAAARKILVAHARISGRSGWKQMGPIAFMRLWIASAEAVATLTKARFVMETATSADFDRLLGGVYARIERGAIPEQQPLPGMLPAGGADLCVRPDPPDPALQPPLLDAIVPSPRTRGSTPVPWGEGRGEGSPPGPQPETRNP